VLNLVLTLFCQDIEEQSRGIDEALAKGKAKNNSIPIMLIGHGKAEAERLR
jgi:hypothetical protein